jgi:hypothetical protein
MTIRHIIGGGLALGILFVAAPSALARTEITCLFSWSENADANIKAHSQRAATLKKVSTKEYDKLVGKELSAKVSVAGGANCTLRHPDNRLINISVRKDEFRLDPAGAMPDCNALQASVKCEGMESPGE